MGTTIETPPAEQLNTVHHHNHWLIVAVIVLAIAVAGLLAWVLYDASTSPDVPTNAEIGQFLDDYNAALGEDKADPFDLEAFREVVTEDFVLNPFYYRLFGAQLARTDYDPVPLSEFSNPTNWQNDAVSAPIVVGDGPWIAARVDAWSGGGIAEEGIGVWVIVDDDGVLRVAEKYFIGFGTQTS